MHHNRVTGRCIVKFDHYCPWVGNAVGALNHKYFCLFLLYTAGTSLTSLLILVLRVIHCGFVVDDNNNNDSTNIDNNAYSNNQITLTTQQEGNYSNTNTF